MRVGGCKKERFQVSILIKPDTNSHRKNDTYSLAKADTDSHFIAASRSSKRTAAFQRNHAFSKKDSYSSKRTGALQRNHFFSKTDSNSSRRTGVLQNGTPVFKSEKFNIGIDCAQYLILRGSGEVGLIKFKGPVNVRLLAELVQSD